MCPPGGALREPLTASYLLGRPRSCGLLHWRELITVVSFKTFISSYCKLRYYLEVFVFFSPQINTFNIYKLVVLAFQVSDWAEGREILTKTLESCCRLACTSFIYFWSFFLGSQLPDKHISVESLDSLAAFRDEKHAGSLTPSGSEGPLDQMVKKYSVWLSWCESHIF